MNSENEEIQKFVFFSLIFVIVTHMWYSLRFHAFLWSLGARVSHSSITYKVQAASPLTSVLLAALHSLIPSIKINSLIWVPMQSFGFNCFLSLNKLKYLALMWKSFSKQSKKCYWDKIWLNAGGGQSMRFA